MRGRLLNILFSLLICSCSDTEFKNTLVDKKCNNNNIVTLPIGNKIISQNKLDINKITIDSFKIEYVTFYDNINIAINDTLKKIEFKFENSHYFSKEENDFFNSLNENNSISSMELLTQSNINYKIYLIKKQSNNLKISEGHGYKSELFLASVSKKNNEILDIINIYNDGIMLYWECLRFFYIDTNVNIYLKDYSIREGEYKCINHQVFNFTSEGSFKRNDALSENEVIVTDSISNFEWKGTYNFNQTFSRSMDEFEIKYSIKIINDQSANLINKVNDKSRQFSPNIVLFNKDSLVLNYMYNNADAEELILYKTKEGYEIGGRTIYLLNPPNDRYPIVRE
jgi:hypothetical protein